MKDVKKIKITWEDGKKVTTYYGLENRIGDSYWVAFFQHMKKYFCLINKNGQPITPPLTKELINFDCTKDHNNIILELKDKEEEMSNFYHFQKKENEYHCVFSTENKTNTPFQMQKTVDSDYYFILSPSNKVALYSLIDAKQITPFFDKLELVEEDSLHLAFFSQKIVIMNYDNDKLVATELVGFIGRQGEFSSRIYDTCSLIYKNQEDRYYTILSSGLNGIKKFQTLCQNLTATYQNYYKETEQKNDEIISELFLEKVELKDTPTRHNLAKIISFPKR